MVRKWRELAPFYFRATATAPLFFTLAPPRRAPPFSVRASGAVALKGAQKVAQVPSNAYNYYRISRIKFALGWIFKPFQ